MTNDTAKKKVEMLIDGDARQGDGEVVRFSFSEVRKEKETESIKAMTSLRDGQESTMDLLAAASETHSASVFSSIDSTTTAATVLSASPLPPLTPPKSPDVSQRPFPGSPSTPLIVDTVMIEEKKKNTNTEIIREENCASPGGKRKRSGIPAASRRRSKSKEPGRWTRMEDTIIGKFIEERQNETVPIDWEVVAKACGTGRSAAACEERWNQVLSRGLYKGRFSEEEDATIRDLAAASGNQSDWRFIASKVNGRTAKQCRERWQNSLDPSLKQGEWSQEEDALLRAAHDRFGNSWGQVVRALPGRSQNMAKNRWNSNARRTAGDAFGLISTISTEKAKALVLALPEESLSSNKTTHSSLPARASSTTRKKKVSVTAVPGRRKSAAKLREEERIRESADEILTLSQTLSVGSLDALVEAASQCFQQLKESSEDSQEHSSVDEKHHDEEDDDDDDQVVLYDDPTQAPDIQIGNIIRYKWGNTNLTDPQAPFELVAVIEATTEKPPPAYTLRCLDLDTRLMRAERNSDFEPFVFTATLSPLQYTKEWLLVQKDASASHSIEAIRSSQSLPVPPEITNNLSQTADDLLNNKRPRRHVVTRATTQADSSNV